MLPNGAAPPRDPRAIALPTTEGLGRGGTEIKARVGIAQTLAEGIGTIPSTDIIAKTVGMVVAAELIAKTEAGVTDAEVITVAVGTVSGTGVVAETVSSIGGTDIVAVGATGIIFTSFSAEPMRMVVLVTDITTKPIGVFSLADVVAKGE